MASWTFLCFLCLCCIGITIDGKECSENQQALPLLIFNDTSNMFEINKSALDLLRELDAPIKVISAVGDARIGKSNAMSVMANYIEAEGKGVV